MYDLNNELNALILDYYHLNFPALLKPEMEIGRQLNPVSFSLRQKIMDQNTKSEKINQTYSLKFSITQDSLFSFLHQQTAPAWHKACQNHESYNSSSGLNRLLNASLALDSFLSFFPTQKSEWVKGDSLLSLFHSEAQKLIVIAPTYFKKVNENRFSLPFSIFYQDEDQQFPLPNIVLNINGADYRSDIRGHYSLVYNQPFDLDYHFRLSTIYPSGLLAHEYVADWIQNHTPGVFGKINVKSEILRNIYFIQSKLYGPGLKNIIQELVNQGFVIVSDPAKADYKAEIIFFTEKKEKLSLGGFYYGGHFEFQVRDNKNNIVKTRQSRLYEWFGKNENPDFETELKKQFINDLKKNYHKVWKP